MAIFSPKVRRLIETAVAQLQDDFQRQTWEAWSSANPETRRADDCAVSFQELPSSVAVVALGALDRLAANLSKELEDQRLDEDEACDLEGDISFIKAVEAMLIERLHASRVAA